MFTDKDCHLYIGDLARGWRKHSKAFISTIDEQDANRRVRAVVAAAKIGSEAYADFITWHYGSFGGRLIGELEITFYDINRYFIHDPVEPLSIEHIDRMRRESPDAYELYTIIEEAVSLGYDLERVS